MRKTLLATTLAAAAALGFSVPPAHAADDVTVHFAMTYVNSQSSGSVHFTSGYTASISGVVRAASGGRAICAYGYNGSTETGGVCSPLAFAGGPDQVLNVALTIPLPGGVQTVVIDMVDANAKVLASDSCNRWGCAQTF